jgi:hypothetical protein
LASAAEQQHFPPDRVVILSSSFPGSPQGMVKSYERTTAIYAENLKNQTFFFRSLAVQSWRK